jgi:phenylalanyl-tRNA synthetase alpha chain
MTELIYLTDSYQQELQALVVSVEKKGNTWEITLDQTIFYPQGGGQPSDKGQIIASNGKAHVKHVRLVGDTVVHECTLEGTIAEGDEVNCIVDWGVRYANMRVHSAGHIVHEATKIVAPSLIPIKGEHGSKQYIEYEGTLPIDKKYPIEKEANDIVQKDVPLVTEFVSLEELTQRAPWVPPHLPKNKPLRILTIGAFPPIPDGGTQVKQSREVGPITITEIENSGDTVRIHYNIQQGLQAETQATDALSVGAPEFVGSLMEVQQAVLNIIASSNKPVDVLRLELLGGKSEFAALTKQIRSVPVGDRQQVGVVINQVKKTIEEALDKKISEEEKEEKEDWIDVTMPGVKPPQGHLHIVTQAINEITDIFARLGFTRVRHPEVDWDWYPFESLNMPPNHPARDEWETFFIEYPGKPGSDPKKQTIVLTPHTSNGQVREMEKGKLPIRMINIAKCYRRQSDISHVPMFHQFEGLFIDRNVSIGDLKGVFDFFVKHFYGSQRVTRLRPFHFQFTEPSFEVDISCGVCLGKGQLADGTPCRLCKQGWLELGGAGMVHPVVLKNGGVDPSLYSGFAFGWGIERTYMMKSGTKLDDIRLLYGNDIRFLEQF